MTHVAPRNPKTNAKTKPLTWAEFEEIWRTGAQLADPTDTIPPAAEIKAKVAEWSQLSVTHGKALFRRIRNQSEVFTEADREELMDFANKAVTGGMMLASLQEGGRRATARHARAKNGRDGNIAKAATWHGIVEELAVLGRIIITAEGRAKRLDTSRRAPANEAFADSAATGMVWRGRAGRGPVRRGFWLG
jgi:hypothetical protein